ncbi:MAG: methyltransferase, partial [Pseudomonadota bacterium]
LAHFWPYVFGAGGATDPNITQTYSDLMADSQMLVAQDTLRTVDFRPITRLLDVGGGTGAFLTAVGHTHPAMDLHLFDLPAVSPGAQSRFRAAGLDKRTTIHTGSFRDDPLPKGADAISLIRVLYDHGDDTVQALLSKIYDTLPPGGRIIVSEPMTGCRAGDVYFALYTLAMRTGRTRSQVEISKLLQLVGFENIQTPAPRRAFVTSVVCAQKPGT